MDHLGLRIVNDHADAVGEVEQSEQHRVGAGPPLDRQPGPATERGFPTGSMVQGLASGSSSRDGQQCSISPMNLAISRLGARSGLSSPLISRCSSERPGGDGPQRQLTGPRPGTPGEVKAHASFLTMCSLGAKPTERMAWSQATVPVTIRLPGEDWNFRLLPRSGGCFGDQRHVLRCRSARLPVCPGVMATAPERPPDRARGGHEWICCSANRVCSQTGMPAARASRTVAVVPGLAPRKNAAQPSAPAAATCPAS